MDRVLRCAGDELMDRRPHCACRPGVRRAGLPRQSPARRRAAAERSGAALIFSITKDYSAACWPEALS